MIQQPRTPPTGQRQAVEVHIKWREVLDYKRDLLRMLSIGTGWSVDKLDQVGRIYIGSRYRCQHDIWSQNFFRYVINTLFMRERLHGYVHRCVFCKFTWL
jgi:hypothetical protein